MGAGSPSTRAQPAQFESTAFPQHFFHAVKFARDVMFLLDEAGQVLECNDAAVSTYGYTRDELRGLNVCELCAPEQRALLKENLRNAARQDGRTFETVHQRKDGSLFPVEVSTRIFEIKGRRYRQSSVRDITERKAAERRIERLTRLYATLSHTNEAMLRARSEEELFADICRIAVENGGMLGAAVRMADENEKTLRPVATSERLRERHANIAVGTEAGLPGADSVPSIAFRENRVCIHNDILADHPSPEWRQFDEAIGIRSVAALPLRRGGRTVGVFVLTHGEPGCFDAEVKALLEEMASDISFTLDSLERERNRKRTERALLESEEKFRGLVEQSIAGIYIIDSGRFTYVNPRFAEIFGYTPQEMIGLDTVACIAEQDRAAVERHVQRRLSGEERSMQFSFTGRRKEGSSITVGVHGSAARNEGRKVIIGLLQDISEREHSQRQIAAHVKQLEEAMVGTLKAVSTLVELRDPYTAGHEQRVGALARAIGYEMGLPEDTCRALEHLGRVHDIGKISIPAEILSKPGRLTEFEFGLIRTHAQAGYDVLKGVAFPWPIATAILQHHERLDGSGYPNGIRSDAIIPEARILAVADVVESMSSHRPYRATLGIDAALGEIETYRGLRYDEKVVDACLDLFRKKGYRLHD